MLYLLELDLSSSLEQYSKCVFLIVVQKTKAQKTKTNVVFRVRLMNERGVSELGISSSGLTALLSSR